METTAREFTRNFRKLRAVAARVKTVRVTAPEGVYVLSREQSHKTYGGVLARLGRFHAKGFLTDGGAGTRGEQAAAGAGEVAVGSTVIFDSTFFVALHRELQRGAAGPAQAFLQQHADEVPGLSEITRGELARGFTTRAA